MYCAHCGQQMRPESEFCSNCGKRSEESNAPSQPVYREPEQPAYRETSRPFYQQAPVSEDVIWVLTAQHKLSFFKLIPCSVVFMKDRAAVAHLTREMQKAESAKASREAKENGLGFFKGTAAMMHYWSNYNKKYYTMAQSEILAEDSSNFVIHYHELKKVLFQAESITTDSDGKAYGSKGRLSFDLSTGETIKFTHSHSHDGTTRETLSKLFGEKLKYKK